MEDNDSVQTIMVVENDEDVRFTLRMLLEREGYRVVEAVEGEEAIALAQSRHPDLILMDLGLGQVSGIVAAQRISELHGMSSVPIVAVTAYDAPEVRDTALSMGCKEFLTKPFDPEHLKNVIKRLLPKQKL